MTRLDDEWAAACAEGAIGAICTMPRRMTDREILDALTAHFRVIIREEIAAAAQLRSGGGGA